MTFSRKLAWAFVVLMAVSSLAIVVQSGGFTVVAIYYCVVNALVLGILGFWLAKRR